MTLRFSTVSAYELESKAKVSEKTFLFNGKVLFFITIDGDLRF